MIDIDKIDKKADLFGMEEDDGFAVMNDDKRDGFKAGAEWMREELTRWNDPKEVLPHNDARVLCKVDGCAYTEFLVLNWYNNEWWMYHKDPEDFGFPEGTWAPFCGTVLSWREIHE